MQGELPKGLLTLRQEAYTTSTPCQHYRNIRIAERHVCGQRLKFTSRQAGSPWRIYSPTCVLHCLPAMCKIAATPVWISSPVQLFRPVRSLICPVPVCMIITAVPTMSRYFTCVSGQSICNAGVPLAFKLLLLASFTLQHTGFILSEPFLLPE